VTVKLVRGDNYPLITLTLTDEATELPIDLSAGSTTVNVEFRPAGQTTNVAVIPCTKPSGGADGKVQFFFPGTTLDVEPGNYEGEIVISFNGLRQTVYDVIKFKVRGT